MRRIIWIAIVLALLLIGAALGWKFFNSRPTPAAGTPAVTTEYRCSAGKSIMLSVTGTVGKVTLSDGRKLTLTLAPVEDGLRFANESGSIVLWAKDFSAFLEESGQTTYQGCRVYPLEF